MLDVSRKRKWIPLPCPTTFAGSTLPPPIICRPLTPPTQPWHFPNSTPIVRWSEHTLLHQRPLDCFAPNEPILCTAIPTTANDPQLSLEPLPIRQVREPARNRLGHHELTIVLNVVLNVLHLTTTDQRVNRVSAQTHIISTLSQLQNVDKVIIWNIMHLLEFDGPKYYRRAQDLQYPFVWHTIYHGEHPPLPETIVH